MQSNNQKATKMDVIQKSIRTIRKKLMLLPVPLLVRVSPVLATQLIYLANNGTLLNLKDPKNYHDKFHWLKLYWRNPLVVQCADKYEVRKFIEERHCKEILNELYGVYVHTKEIDWNLFPEKFVLKTTNACGTNIICRNKGTLDKQDALEKLDKWLKLDYGLKHAEIFYSKMTPRIICEKYIETEDGLVPNDYKVYCFNGNPKFILAISGRDMGNPRMQTFDLKWNELDYVKDESKGNLNIHLREPRTLDQMVYYAKKLSKGFPYVRVDFYDVNGSVIFGEMTFAPAAGYKTIFNEEAVNRMGGWIELPDRKILYV
jgi:hypothetical protein